MLLDPGAAAGWVAFIGLAAKIMTDWRSDRAGSRKVELDAGQTIYAMSERQLERFEKEIADLRAENDGLRGRINGLEADIAVYRMPKVTGA